MADQKGQRVKRGDSMNNYDKYAAAKAQEKYCKERGLPYFAPPDGKCYRCGKNIYERYTRNRATFSWFRPNESSDDDVVTTGITVEAAGSHLVTGCPHCNYSYCE